MDISSFTDKLYESRVNTQIANEVRGIKQLLNKNIKLIELVNPCGGTMTIAATWRIVSVADIDQGKESVIWLDFSYDTQTWLCLYIQHCQT